MPLIIVTNPEYCNESFQIKFLENYSTNYLHCNKLKIVKKINYVYKNRHNSTTQGQPVFYKLPLFYTYLFIQVYFI